MNSLSDILLFPAQNLRLGTWVNFKTLALQATCNHLSLHPNATALWIDTTGDFSPTKADIILRSTEPHEVCVPSGMPQWWRC
jgi:hypothetical protein